MEDHPHQGFLKKRFPLFNLNPEQGRKIAVAILLLTALILRLHQLGSRSYFNDELSALYRTTPATWSALVEDGIKPDFHPAGIQVFLYYYTRMVGTNPFWARLPFALAGTLAVWLLYLIAARWFGRTSGWLAATSLAFLEFPVFYSQLARPYSTGLLIILASVLFWHNALFKYRDNSSKQRNNLIAMALCFTLAMYNHYFSLIAVGMIGITGLFYVTRNSVIPYLLAGLASLTLYIPHLGISIDQVSRGGLSSWLPPPGEGWFHDHLLYLFNNNPFIPILLLVPGGIALIIKFRKKSFLFIIPDRTKHPSLTLIPWLWYFLPLVFAWFWSVQVNPIFQNSIMLFVFPFLLIAIFHGTDYLPHPLKNVFAITIPLILLTHLLFFSDYYQKDHFANFKKFSQTTFRIIQNEKNTAWATEVNNPWYFHYYLSDSTPISPPLFYSSMNLNLPELDRRISCSTNRGMVYSTLRPANPMVISMIRQRFPYLAGYEASGHFSELYYFTDLLPPHISIPGYAKDTFLFASYHPSTPQDRSFRKDEFQDIYDDEIPGTPPLTDAFVHGTITIQTTRPPETLQWVFTTARGEQQTSWNALHLGKWQHRNGNYYFTLRLPDHFRKGDHLKVYLWNPGKEEFHLEKAEIMLIHQNFAIE